MSNNVFIDVYFITVIQIIYFKLHPKENANILSSEDGCYEMQRNLCYSVFINVCSLLKARSEVKSGRHLGAFLRATRAMKCCTLNKSQSFHLNYISGYNSLDV